MSSDHSSSVFNNSCLKTPLRPSSGQPFPINDQKHLNHLRNQARKLADEKTRSKTTLKSFLEFYGSIPEYDDVNHLSNKEFYRRLENLREKQRLYEEKLKLEGDFERKNSASRRSVRIETPSERDEWEELSVEDLKLDLQSQQGESKSAPASPIRNVGWKDTITIPQPFQMTVRDEENKIVEEVLVNTKKPKKDEKLELFKAHPVPIESQIPLFDKIMEDQQKRSNYIKRKRKAELLSNMQPFSFTKRDEELQALTKRLSKSSPSIFLDSPPLKIKQFKAKPIPKNLFSNYVYKKMHEDEFYRALQKKIRAEEMLKASSLPPSMAKRERVQSKPKVCTKMGGNEDEDIFTGGRNKKRGRNKKKSCLEKEFEDLQREFVEGGRKTNKDNIHRIYSGKTTTTSNSTPDLPLDSTSRQNLAAVLRIQSARKRMEIEMCKRLEEAKLKDETRWKEKLMRKRPVWQTLAYSQEEDLAMRLQLRRDEERLRNEEHKHRMQLMYGRVNQQPTLFERQSKYLNNPKLRQQVLECLYKDFDDYQESISENSSENKKSVEMKDEEIQALDEEIDSYLLKNAQTESETQDEE